MRRSKLESYEDILGVLVNEPFTVDRIAYKTNMDCATLAKYIEYLRKNGLVRNRKTGPRDLYAITEKGIAVLKALDFQKYLTRIANKIRVIDDALEAIRELDSKKGKDKK